MLANKLQDEATEEEDSSLELMKSFLISHECYLFRWRAHKVRRRHGRHLADAPSRGRHPGPPGRRLLDRRGVIGRLL